MTDYGRQYRYIYVQFGHQNVSGGWDTPIRKGDEMSVRRRRDTKTPRWTARWKNSAGRWQTKDFKTKAEFEAGQRREPPDQEAVRLRQRAQPFMDLLKRSHQSGDPVVWGV